MPDPSPPAPWWANAARWTQEDEAVRRDALIAARLQRATKALLDLATPQERAAFAVSMWSACLDATMRRGTAEVPPDAILRRPGYIEPRFIGVDRVGTADPRNLTVT